MIIEIKGKQYLNPGWRVENGIAQLRIRSDATFEEISEDFVLTQGECILQFNDSEQQISAWYVEGMASIELPGEDKNEVVIIKYHVSQLAKDAQDSLQTDVDDASDAVLELCEMISEQQSTLSDTCARIEGSQKDQQNRMDALSQTLNLHTVSIGNLESMFNTLADRVARLENGGK